MRESNAITNPESDVLGDACLRLNFATACKGQARCSEAMILRMFPSASIAEFGVHSGEVMDPAVEVGLNTEANFSFIFGLASPGREHKCDCRFRANWSHLNPSVVVSKKIVVTLFETQDADVAIRLLGRGH